MRLLVLDRDGVINEDSENYIRGLADWHPIPGSLDAIARLSRAGFGIVVATNQSGLSRGLFSQQDLEAIHARLCREVEARGGRISGIFYCPHLPEDACHCRKPGTGLLVAIERELGESLRGAPFIGDSLKDLQAALAFGCQPVLVRTGKGEGTLATLESTDGGIPEPVTIPVYRDLAAAADALLARCAQKSDISEAPTK
jgi:D-glycero-D-manno-heptose 1,7-bisphosphate phosphatase